MRNFRAGNAFLRRVTVGAATLATTGVLSLGFTTSAQADSLGKYIDLSNDVKFNQAAAHSWASTTVHLNWQSDGNLVLYCNSGKVLWSTNTYVSRTGANNAYIEFTGGGITLWERFTTDFSYWKQMWHENGSNANAYAYVQNDGNFVIYNQGGSPVWASGTNNEC
ncbi:hypothetical protein ABZ646_07375 [Streptomyces sp. NPDC007162]|uniref:hypothetical protein n=1 Tax=Streptomyces sp. NPDC007162 TaxID=3156917 RepID=UPI003410FA74